jgi:hypothetical protein
MIMPIHMRLRRLRSVAREIVLFGLFTCAMASSVEAGLVTCKNPTLSELEATPSENRTSPAPEDKKELEEKSDKINLPTRFCFNNYQREIESLVEKANVGSVPPAAAIQELERWIAGWSRRADLPEADRSRSFTQRKLSKLLAMGGDYENAERRYRDAFAATAGANRPDDLVAALDEMVEFYISKRRDLSAVEILEEIRTLTKGVDLPPRATDLLIRKADAFYALVPRFSNAEHVLPGCNAANRSGTTHALLVGVQNYPKGQTFRGPQNDVELLAASLNVRGVKNVKVLFDATRTAIATEMRRLLETAQCGDFVFFHYSGGSAAPMTIPGLNVPDGWEGGLAPIDYTVGDLVTPIWNAEISEFVTAIRNRGATVFLVIDALTHALPIKSLQVRAAGSHWQGVLSQPTAGKWNVAGSERDGVTPLNRIAGAYAVVDYSGVELEIEGAAGEKRYFGVLSYALGRALQTQAQPNIEQVATSLANELTALPELTRSNYAEVSKGTIVSNDPKMVLLLPTASLRADKLGIEIISPKFEKTRGAISVDEPAFEVVGRVADHRSLSLFTVNYKPVPLDGNGQFRTRIELAAGQNQVTFAGFGFDYRFRIETLDFSYDGDVNRLAASGERYALVIGNQNYEKWTPLTTPHSDAKAVAALLTQQYGFRTSLDLAAGGTRSLVLLDAKQEDIFAALNLLRQRLTALDSLLIYYAGHGMRLADNQVAYWIPKDGDRDNDLTWISAQTLTGQLKRMSARSILVVSDSCFSGAMTRDAPDLSAFGQDRRQALLKAGNRKSRIFISSGGTEPVLDRGCPESDEHSVFACAFLQALKQIKDPVFSSGELHHMYLLPRVSGRVPQQPERKELADSGHDNGEFIFARIEAQAAGRELEIKANK